MLNRSPLLTLLTLLLVLPLALAACSSKKDPAPVAGQPDAGAPDLDASAPDAEPPPPLPCLFDQGGEANRGCDPGQVCDLSASPARCVAGIGCSADSDCDRCAALPTPSDCGHGLHLVSFCDERHAAPGSPQRGTCTRARAPCEPCASDEDCGRNHPVLGGAASRCLDYEGGAKFCGRACTGGCPDGFTCDPTENQCRKSACAALPVVCPVRPESSTACAGTDQICRGEECPGTGGARCSTNNQPGALGVCIGFCASDADCPAETPVCNAGNGICVAGCARGSCAEGQTCHVDGFCHPECSADSDCASRFGAETYCNLPAQPPPRYFKEYHDARSCRRLGCEQQADCAVAGRVCNDDVSPPVCVDGCHAADDCAAGEVCKSAPGQPTASFSREACRGLPDLPSAEALGVCCNPGCTDRVLQCQINEFCCGEVGSPFEAGGSCPTLTSTGGAFARPGQCFEMPVPEPWCHVCSTPDDCGSGYTRGFNVDPTINGGQPFQEQEWCMPIAMGLRICSVTCNPNLEDTQCPRGWNCRPFSPPCLTDDDCTGLECIGEDTTRDPPVPGRCKCGSGGAPAAACPTDYPALPSPVVNPRCVALGDPAGDLVCVASYHCAPPGLSVNPETGATNYPAACGF